MHYFNRMQVLKRAKQKKAYFPQLGKIQDEMGKLSLGTAVYDVF